MTTGGSRSQGRTSALAGPYAVGVARGRGNDACPPRVFPPRSSQEMERRPRPTRGGDGQARPEGFPENWRRRESRDRLAVACNNARETLCRNGAHLRAARYRAIIAAYLHRLSRRSLSGKRPRGKSWLSPQPRPSPFSHVKKSIGGYGHFPKIQTGNESC